MNKRKTICAAGVAALSAVPAHAVPVDCWWGDPTKGNEMQPYNCDMSKRYSNGKKLWDVYIKEIGKRFTIHLVYENDDDNYGTATWWHKGNKLPGHWHYDEDNDVQVGVSGQKTNFAFVGLQLIQNRPAPIPVRDTLQDTPFRF